MVENNEFPPGEGAGGPAAEGGDAPLNTGRPAVAAAPGKLIFVLLFAGIFVFIIVRSIFFGEKEAPPKEEKHAKEHVMPGDAKGGGEISISPNGNGLPSLPTEMAAPPTPPPPPLPPPPPPLNAPVDLTSIHTGAPVNEALSRRIHSPMFAIQGQGSQKLGANRRKSAVSAGNDPNGAFADSVAGTKAEDAVATRVENLNTTIVQGKLIHVVLESAIDSTVPGPIRGIVSHDIYAESGRDILIPKGSRLVGVYNSQIRHSQARVFIIWERLIRPDGVDILIDSPAVDGLGRAGIAGDLDSHYFEMFSTALLTSSMAIGVAAVGDALFGNQQTTTTNNGTGSSTTSSPTSTAMQAAVQNIGSVGNSIVSNVLNTQPTINIDQGTPMEVFVNRDLIFPREVTGASGGFIN